MTAFAPPRFTTLTSRLVALPDADIDTDRIIPARFLKVTDKAGLGNALFVDWRRGRNDFPLDQPDAVGARILLAGPNFGCGSSREHAPWALCAAGFAAIISTSFADIFCNNALKNGLLPVAVSPEVASALFAARARDASLEVSIDLETQQLTLPGGIIARFPVDAFARRCLLDGVDELGYLLSHLPQIEAYEARF